MYITFFGQTSTTSVGGWTVQGRVAEPCQDVEGGGI